MKRLLVIAGNSLIVIAFVALVWCAAFFLRAQLEQIRALNVLKREASTHSSDRGKVDNVRSDVPLGRIDIPRIGVSSVILEGTDGDILALSVGHIHGTALPGSDGNVALAAHRDTFFRGLENIQIGDGILLTAAGRERTYEVDSRRIVAPNDVYVLNQTDSAKLTLVTCFPFHYFGPAPKRFIVQAHLIRRLLLGPQMAGADNGGLF